LKQIKLDFYEQCGLAISDFEIELESKEYAACRFQLNGLNVICRTAKITPKKTGQFVTFWKRNGKGPIQPFDDTDPIDFYVVNVSTENQSGQFVFPTSVLIKRGVISTEKKEGKRAFRVYASWDIPKNKQAESTQKWQLDYFFERNELTDFNKIAQLYQGTQ